MASHDAPATGHERIETSNFLMIVLILIALSIGGLVEIVPLFFQKSTTQPIEGVKPYGALQLAGRDVYIREGCYNCHSQMVRPIYAETQRYGEYSKPGEFVYDRPFQWGSRRIGPDLAREGVNNPNASWHYQHFENPQVFTTGSIMPSYKHLVEGDLDYGQIQSRIRALAMIGTPYGDAVKNAESMAREQAKIIADDIRAQMPGFVLPEDLEDKKVIALIAYIKRLGTDIYRTPEPADAAAEAAPAAAEEGGAH
ncbi:MAG: cytochrome-c oxidase, cbb3-type subunit II [Phycisphaerales bacterium]|nr:cytochrome-c oxidase, cbb3-type subunit II [Phycisphaerales bacterium]